MPRRFGVPNNLPGDPMALFLHGPLGGPLDLSQKDANPPPTTKKAGSACAGPSFVHTNLLNPNTSFQVCPTLWYAPKPVDVEDGTDREIVKS